MHVDLSASPSEIGRGGEARQTCTEDVDRLTAHASATSAPSLERLGEPWRSSAAPRWHRMARVRVFVEPERLDPEELREMLDSEGCGSVVSFVGLTRGEEQGTKVERLEFDVWEERLPEVLSELAEHAIELFGVFSVVIAHRTGSVGPGESIVCIHVASPHRAEGFEACSWLIDQLKRQAPLWKKEVRADGEVWKAGLG